MDAAILARVEDFCIREGLLQPGTPLRLAAAVSGGADSMALLLLLRQLQPRFGYTLSACHVNHGLRGQSADRDEAFVQALLQKLSHLAPRVVLTGVSFDDDHLGAMSYDRTTGRYFAYYNEKVHAGFHGTGDIFTATVLGAMMQGRTLEQAVTLAVDFTLECIRCTCADPAASWYGVEFEKALPWLARQNNAGAE